VKTEILDFDLPQELVAQEPARDRTASRLLVLSRRDGSIRHLRFSDLPSLLRAGDLLVVNDTKVLKGRLRSRRSTGGAVELLLLSPLSPPGREERWEALARPSARLSPGDALPVGEGFSATLLSRAGRGRWEVSLTSGSTVAEALERYGEIPLPPYIRRERGDGRLASDAERYQTVYASEPGSVAAPTAGLHFDGELLSRLDAMGVERAAVTLSVGYGTFSPVRTEALEEHPIHRERYRLPEETARAVARARARGGRVVAVGTTSVRVLETCADGSGGVAAGEGETSLFLFPGRPFSVVDALVTNFHLPRSSLLALVMAFAGVDAVREAYRAAVAGRYRFFSYGDAMFVE
jgi:S-adenosylmethionine:tRNA ribosyltransferase-isomerase